jgi:hypothetical protein
LLSEYAQELAELAEESKGNIAILTDYDIPGLLIASQLPEAFWIGINEDVMREFGIEHDNDQLVVSYNPQKTRVKLEQLQEDDRFAVDSDAVDFDFLEDHKVEIDAVLAHVGAARLWDYIKQALEERYKKRNYLRVIEPRPDALDEHYPQSIKDLNAYLDQRAEEITEDEREKIAAELQEVEGFIDVEDKRKEIDKRHGDIIRDDETLNDVAAKIKEVLQEEEEESKGTT